MKSDILNSETPMLSNNIIIGKVCDARLNCQSEVVRISENS
jgi:hypothetical protein